MCTGLGNDGEAEGVAPVFLCMQYSYCPWGEQKEGLGGDLQAVHIHLSTHLSMHTCHVYRSMFQICIFTSETFMPPFKCYYSMYYPYLGHCPKAFEGQGQD